MARTTFTDRSLKALKPAAAGQRYDLFDAVVPGLGVRVSDRSKKFFLLARFPPSTNSTRRSMGEFPALPLAAARETARQWLDLIDKGIDPAVKVEEEKQERDRAAVQKRDRSYETVMARYIAQRRRDGIRKAGTDEADFRRYCLPHWRGRAIADLTMADILRVVEGIRDRGKTRQALNVSQKIGTFLKWCEDDEVIETSPFKTKRIRIAIGTKQSRDRVLNDDEIKVFWTATGKLDPARCAIYRLLLMSGQRLNDVAMASWNEIDFDRKTLTIPAARFKSGRDHVIPLTDDMLAILQGVKRWPGCKWVFSLNGQTPVGMRDNAVKSRLDRAMAALTDEPIAPWVNHDLRRTMRTRLAELDVFDEIAEAVIGHQPPSLVRVYNQSDRLRAKADALGRWERALRQIINPAAMPDNVVPLHAG